MIRVIVTVSDCGEKPRIDSLDARIVATVKGVYREDTGERRRLLSRFIGHLEASLSCSNSCNI
jgi:hypothetical protein